MMHLIGPHTACAPPGWRAALTIASTSKDATTGKLVTEEYHVEGPVMLALTTTAAEIDEELLNRCAWCFR